MHGGSTYCQGNIDENGMVTTTNCPATNKSTTLNTTATPLPLPAKGQASALLEDRKSEPQANLERLKAQIGFGVRKKYQPLSEAEFEKNQKKQVRALLGDKKIEK